MNYPINQKRLRENNHPIDGRNVSHEKFQDALEQQKDSQKENEQREEQLPESQDESSYNEELIERIYSAYWSL